MSVVFPDPAIPITMHAVGWRWRGSLAEASAVLDEAAAGDEAGAEAAAAAGSDIAQDVWTPGVKTRKDI